LEAALDILLLLYRLGVLPIGVIIDGKSILATILVATELLLCAKEEYGNLVENSLLIFG
jgi:hypothetical protein